LCRSLIAAARKHGTTKRIELFCREDNRNAVRFYQKLGFEIEGILRNRFLVDGAYSNDLVMGYLLDPADSSQDVQT
jgi:RimJ/RimL family protein N-acetyltransferase